MLGARGAGGKGGGRVARDPFRFRRVDRAARAGAVQAATVPMRARPKAWPLSDRHAVGGGLQGAGGGEGALDFGGGAVEGAAIADDAVPEA